MNYSRRNGETEPPTVDGWYWFVGKIPEPKRTRLPISKTMVQVFREGVVSPSYFDKVSYLQGQWWGPVTPPWEVESPPDLGVQVSDATRVADRMG